MDTQTIRVSLCSRDACPTAEITGSEVLIRDDFGGQVKITREHCITLLEKIKESTR